LVKQLGEQTSRPLEDVSEPAIQPRPTLPETVARAAEPNEGMITDLSTSRGKVH
jgi:hypothetical protein